MQKQISKLIDKINGIILSFHRNLLRSEGRRKQISKLKDKINRTILSFQPNIIAAYFLIAITLFVVIETRKFIDPHIVVCFTILTLMICIFETLYYLLSSRSELVIEKISRKYPDFMKDILRHCTTPAPNNVTSYLNEWFADMHKNHNIVSDAFLRFAWLFARFILMVCFLSLISYSTVQYFSKNNDPFFKGITYNSNYLDHIYFNTITIATVGYGDITPNDTVSPNRWARSFVIFSVFCGLSYLIIGASFYSDFFKTSPNDYYNAIKTYIEERSIAVDYEPNERKASFNDGEFRKRKSRSQHTVDNLGTLLVSTGKENETLLRMANCLREEYFGNNVYLRGVLEISNYCDLNCLYCGMRRDNQGLHRFRLAPPEVLEVARIMKSSGMKSIMLQSGDDYSFPVNTLIEMIRVIKKETSLHVMLCLGERNSSDLKKMWEAGADMYILKLETSDPVLYSKMRPQKTLEQRLNCMTLLKKIGYELSSGFIVGLPDQTDKELVEGILLLKDIGVRAASVSPFIPNDSSPLAAQKAGNLEKTCNMMAMMRIMLGDVLIPSVSALSMLGSGEDGQLIGLKAGANVITINFTPESLRKDYLIYNSHRNIITSNKAAQMIAKAGLSSSLKLNA